MEKGDSNINRVNKDKRRLDQIPLEHQSLEELKELVSFLKEKGYKIMHGLDNINDYNHIVAVVVYNEDNTLCKSNITCMANWCNFKRKPLTIQQFFKYYDRLIVEKDEEFYNTLIENNLSIRKKLDRKKALINKLYDLVDLLEVNEKEEYADELADVVNELIPLLDNLGSVNDVWLVICSVIMVVNKYPKLQNAVYALKQKQLILKGLK